MRCRTPPPSLPHFLLHAAPHPEPLPLACLPRVRFKMSRPPRRTLFSPPSLSSAHGHGHTSVTRSPHFPNSRPHRRSSRRCPHRISDRRRHRFSPSPSQGETRLSTTISLFGAALTSLILPRSSRSYPGSSSTLPPVRTQKRAIAPSRHPASQSTTALGAPPLLFPGALPVVPTSSPATPYLWLATTGPSASAPPCRPLHGLRAARPGRQAEAQSTF
jgi:hypothetical protein